MSTTIICPKEIQWYHVQYYNNEGESTVYSYYSHVNVQIQRVLTCIQTVRSP
jgi:hypothetical protein